MYVLVGSMARSVAMPSVKRSQLCFARLCSRCRRHFSLRSLTCRAAPSSFRVFASVDKQTSRSLHLVPPGVAICRHVSTRTSTCQHISIRVNTWQHVPTCDKTCKHVTVCVTDVNTWQHVPTGDNTRQHVTTHVNTC